MFPSSPAVNDTAVVGRRVWIWDGDKWLQMPFSTTQLGIGTATPGSSLDVNGMIRTTGADTTWPTSGRCVAIYQDGTSGVVEAYDYDLDEYFPLVINGNGVSLRSLGATNPASIDVTNFTNYLHRGCIVDSPIRNPPTSGGGLVLDLPFRGGGINSNCPAISAFDYGAAAYQRLDINGTPLILNMDSGGNVGIGTESPQAALDVNRTIRVSDNSGPLRGVYSSHSGVRGFVSGGDWGGFHELDIDANPLLLCRQDISNGLVGVGLLFPKYKLDVQDVINITGSSSGNGSCGSYSFSNSQIAATDQRIAMIEAYTGTADSGELTFSTATLGLLSERMRITSSGNVGIGTQTPQYTLDVAGDINSSGIIWLTEPHGSTPYQFQISSWNSFGFVIASSNASQTMQAPLHIFGYPLMLQTDPNDGSPVGNVGIGLIVGTPPAYRLEVAGDVNISSGGSVYRITGIPLASANANGTQIDLTNVATINGAAPGTGGTSQWTDIAGGGIYYNGGNVGIGTASPGSTLTVSGSTQLVDGRSGTFDVAVSITNNNGGAAVAAGVLRIAVANTDSANAMIVCVNSSGSVFEVRADGTIYIPGALGIGTVTPEYQLDVGGAGANAYSRLGATAIIRADAGYEWFLGNFTDASGSWQVTRREISSGTWNNILTATPAGNVGIGTTAPGYPLDVQATSTSTVPLRLTGSAGNPATNNTQLRFAGGTVGEQWAMGLDMLGIGGRDFFFWDLVIGPVVTLQQGSGNVGIGTSNPQDKVNIANVTNIGFLVNDPSGFRSWIGTRDGSALHLATTSGTPGDAGYGGIHIAGTHGNIGIGTTSPSSRLVVCADGSNINNQLILRPSDGNNTYGLGIGYTIVNGDWRGTLQVLANNVAYPLILNPWGGNVGINAGNPTARLQIEQPPGGNWNLYLTQSSASWITADDFTSYRFIQTASAAVDGNFKFFAVGAGGVGIGYGTPPYGSNDALYVNGNVGIGTATPAYTLDVQSPSSIPFRLTGSAGNPATNNTQLRFAGGTVGDQWVMGLDIIATGSRDFYLWDVDKGSVVTFQKGGNVGIGVLDPAFCLDVITPVRIRNTEGMSGIWYDNAWATQRFFAGTDASIDGWRIYTPGGNAVVVHSSGYVGINTGAPSSYLGVVSNAWSPSVNGITGMAICASGAFGGGIGLVDGPYTMSLYSNAGDLIFGNGYWDTPSTGRMVLKANGYLGINTTTVPDPLTVAGVGAGQLRLTQSAYSVIFRNDDTYFYMLLTNAWDAYGSFNGLRPFSINLSNGDLNLNQFTCLANGNCSMAGDLTVFRGGNPGTGAIYFGNSGGVYINWDGGNFVFSHPIWLSSGNLTVGNGGITTTGNISSGGNMNAANYYRGGVGVITGDGAAVQTIVYNSQNIEQVRQHGPHTTIGLVTYGGATMTFNNMAGIGATWAITAAASDVRLKQNIEPLTGGLEVIDQLRPVSFEWNGLLGHERGQRMSGVLGHEVQQVIPEAVYPFPARLHPEDTEDTEILGFETMSVVAHLILAVQELKREMESLKKKVN